MIRWPERYDPSRAARVSSLIFPNRMSRFHQLWLDRLAEKAKDGQTPGA